MKISAVIPCRYQSSRFEGKPLVLIGNKPMMWHVYQRALLAKSISEAWIATDSDLIKNTCKELGLKVIMTSPDHLTGTDRVAECAQQLGADIIVNVQGDEPFIAPESIDSVANALTGNLDPNISVSNGCSLITNEHEAHDDGVVKTTFSASHHALAYSRLPIPFGFRSQPRHFRQLGLYAFRPSALAFYLITPQGPIERAEAVEMYRFIEHDVKVLMVEVEESGIAVDTPADLYKARLHFEKHSAE